MPIPVADSIELLLDRIEKVMIEELPVELAARDSSEYPLPVPDAWICVDATFDEIARHLGSPIAYGTIVDSPSELEDRGTGDGTEEPYNQVTEVSVSVVLKQPAGVKLPTRNGREVMLNQWMKTRCERYRGALQNVLARDVADGVTIHQVELERTGVSPSTQQKSGTYREAAVVITVTQHVSVKVRS